MCWKPFRQHVSEQLTRIEGKLDAALVALGTLQTEETLELSEIDDLRQAVSDIKDEVAGVATAEGAMADRVETIINTLKSNPSAADVEAAATDLQGVKASLETIKGALDSLEAPAPPPTP